MSRSGYSDDYEYLDLYRKAVDNAIKGKRGQAFLRELAQAMDAMPEKVLIQNELINWEGSCCAIGVVCKARQIAVDKIDDTDHAMVGEAVGIARSMAAEIAYMNDEFGVTEFSETPEQRWVRMRKWVQDSLVE